MAAESLGQNPSLNLSDEVIDELSWPEIARAGWRIARMRVVILPVMLCIIALVVSLDPAPWRIWLLATAGPLGLGVAIRDFFWLKHRDLEPRHVPYLLSLVVIMQITLIALTGGSESPFFIVLIPMVVLPAMVVGHLRSFALFMLFPASAIWIFTIAGVHGWLGDLKPHFWGPGIEFRTNAVYAYTQAAVVTFAMAIGGAIAVFLRLAIRRGARTVIEARQALLMATREQNRDLMTLTGEIAHELKNPLASIQGLSGLLARKLPEGSKEAEQMAVLIAEVKRMGTTLDEFLNFSRPVSGLAVRSVHPATLLADVTLIHEGLAHQHEVSLRVDPGDAVALRCDPRKVKQVLVNLLQNALDATPRGGTVTARTAHGAGVARFIIEDTGPGLASEVRDRIFRPGATTKPDGSGLGLVIARAIAEQHGGSVTLTDRPEGGCRAELTLPLSPPADAEEPRTQGEAA